MIRLVTALATAGLVVWVASQSGGDGGLLPPGHPLRESARQTVKLVGETMAVAASPDESPPGERVAAPPAFAAEPALQAPEPVDPAGLVLAPGQIIAAREPFVPDAPAAPEPVAETFEHVAEVRAPPARSPLDRESADEVRGRLDRVMGLASGRER